MEYLILQEVNVQLLYPLKTCNFLVFSGDIKREHWAEIGESILKHKCCFELSVIDSANKHKDHVCQK